MSVKYSFKQITVIGKGGGGWGTGGMYGRGGDQKLVAIRIQSSSEINLEADSR